MRAITAFLLFCPALVFSQSWKPVDDITALAGPPTPHSPVRTGTAVHKSASGVTLSSTPLTPDRVGTPERPLSPIAEDLPGDAGLRLAQQCLQGLRSNFFDPYSLQLDGYQTYRMPSGEFGVVVLLNAKNRWGGYVGAKPYHCFRDGPTMQAGQGGL